MNYFPFFNHSPSYSQQNFLCTIEFCKKFEQMSELLNKKDVEIQLVREENRNLKQTIIDISNKIQNEDKKSKPIRKITKNYYRRNSCGGSDKNSRIYCPYSECHHHYSSILALNFHIKYKHNGGNKKQRQAYAKIIVEAQLNDEEPPKINFNFPPGFLQKYRTNFLKSKKFTDLQKKQIQNENQHDNQNAKTE